MSLTVLEPKQSRTRPRPAPSHRLLADRLGQTLAEHRMDCAPLNQLAHFLGAAAAALLTATAYAPELGICTDEGQPLVYRLPRQPIAAGFRPVCRGGRMWLRLPGHGPRPALWITGRRIGPARAGECGAPMASGELAYTLNRLVSMAADWLPDGPDPARYLFELIAQAWWHGSGTRQLGGLAVHRARFEAPVTLGPNPANQLELVTNRCGTGRELINAYPIPALGVAQ